MNFSDVINESVARIVGEAFDSNNVSAAKSVNINIM